MPSSYSPLNRFEEQNPGEGLNTWGSNLNTKTTALIDFAVSGETDLTISGPITLTSSNGAADQARSATLKFTSGTGGTVTIPAVTHHYRVRNSTSGSVIFTTGSGTTATVEAGNFATVVCDGTNCWRHVDAADIAAALATAEAYTDAAAFASSSGVLPGQGGNAGKFLQTNGTSPSWVAISSSNVTTALGFTPQAALGFTPLNPANNLSDIASLATTRSNLNVGQIGTSGGTTPLLSGTNAWSGKQTYAGSTTSGAFFNLTPGVTPTAAVNGDFWVTGTDAFAQIGGTAVSLGSTTGSVTSVNTRTGAVTIISADVTTALGFTPANVASPTLTGVPAAPTAAPGTNTTQLATTAFVATSFAPLASPVLTGAPLSTTPTTGDNSTKIATTAYVQSNLASFLTTATAASTYAPLASPALTGTPTAPTASGATNTTQIATTAFVQTNFALLASPALTGNPTAPTQTAGNSSTRLATTAFVATSFAPLASPSFTGDSTFGGAAQTTPVVVTFNATTMTLNAALSNVFTTTFTANVTSAPTISNPNDGQTINWFITQDGTGTRTMTWPTSFKWPGGTAGVLSTAINSVDLLVATYRASTGFWYAALSKAFS